MYFMFMPVNRRGWRLTQGQRLLTIATRSRRMGLRMSALWALWTPLTALAGQHGARRAPAATRDVAAGARPRSVAVAYGSPQPGAGPQGR